jgi:succinate dehydrogenase / fumarate reductase, iron-sulfur subunit
MRLALRIWRQINAESQGRLISYEIDDISPDMSFLEVLDRLNERLILAGDEPVAFDHDCREGICGACGVMINGRPHGALGSVRSAVLRRGGRSLGLPGQTTTCQLHMRMFHDNDIIDVEPWRSAAFPVIKDLVVDRSAFDRIIGSGGYITAPTGSAPDANAIAVPKPDADAAFANATCIGCGACVAACPNGSAMLFTAAKVTHLNRLPQGAPERSSRVLGMVTAMDAEGFGGCTNSGECASACPKEIPLASIANLNREYLKAARNR